MGPYFNLKYILHVNMVVHILLVLISFSFCSQQDEVWGHESPEQHLHSQRDGGHLVILLLPHLSRQREHLQVSSKQADYTHKGKKFLGSILI